MKVTLYWDNGDTTTAESFADLYEKLGAKQPEPVDGETMKKVLAMRGEAWCGKWIDPSLPDRAFLAALSDCGLFKSVRITD